MTPFDIQFCRYIASGSCGNPDAALALLVDAMFKGNGEYIRSLCAKTGQPSDLQRATSEILRHGGTCPGL